MAHENRCETCIEKCPKAGMIHEIAKGRMFATNAFIALQRKVESGELAEVVRCADCEHWMYEFDDIGLCVVDAPDVDGVQRRAGDFCSYGKRRDETDA